MNSVTTQVKPSWMSPKIALRQLAEKGGYGVFAVAPIAAGEIVVMWGGEIVATEEFEQLPESIRIHCLQVEEELYLVVRELGPADMVNHSCDPTVGMSGHAGLVALRPIKPGEEIAFDYAMTDSSPYDEFDCACGSRLCRGRVTGADWQRPDLQARYAGYFSPYLERRIAALKSRVRQLNGH